MAGLSAAWRLSEPGWQDRFESITVYQRGWRLGGKAASSRGPHGRIEEHGLHVWLGSYENAFALLRECYAELDRPTTDSEHSDPNVGPGAGSCRHPGDGRSVRSRLVGVAGRFSRNDQLPGDPDATGRELTVVEFLRRALQLVLDFAESLRRRQPDWCSPSLRTRAATGWRAVTSAGGTRHHRGAECNLPPDVFSTSACWRNRSTPFGGALDYERRPDHKRFWLMLALLVATARAG